MVSEANRSKRSQFILIGGTVFAVLALLAYLGAQEYAPKSESGKGAGKPIDPRTLSQSEEITLGLKAAPGLISQYDGVSINPEQKALVMRVGSAIAGTELAAKAGWKFQFQLLAEPDILNAFALPGGQVFMTTGLLNRLRTEGEVAAVLAHQIAHVLARDAVKKLAVDMGGDAAGLGGDDVMGLMAGQLAALRFTTEQETAADLAAIRLMSDTGYNPNALLGLLQVLSTAYYAGAQVEYFSTHPNPEGRVKAIQEAVAKQYPQGVPESLSE